MSISFPVLSGWQKINWLNSHFSNCNYPYHYNELKQLIILQIQLNKILINSQIMKNLKKKVKKVGIREIVHEIFILVYSLTRVTSNFFYFYFLPNKPRFHQKHNTIQHQESLLQLARIKTTQYNTLPHNYNKKKTI